MKPDLSTKTYDPQWTDVVYASAGSRDALGIETLSESILADLLPGINNQTRRARYYSFWPWVLYDFINDSHATHTQDGLYQWLRKREDALILSYLAHGCDSGAAGVNQGNQFWQSGEPETYPLDWKSLISTSGGAYQLYYRGPLQEMNIIRINEESPHDDLTDPLGVRLANAFEASVRHTQYARKFRDATLLTKPILKDFAEDGCLCKLTQHDPERRELIHAFFRFDSEDSFALKRLASLCLFLDIIHQSAGVSLASEQDIRAALYFWSFGGDQAYVPEGNVLSAAQRWRVFQLRQYFVFAVESVWSLFLYRVNATPMGAGAYLSALLSELDIAVLGEAFGLRLPDADARRLKLSTLYEAARDALPVGALEPGPTSFVTDLNEHALAGPMWRNYSVSDVQIRIGQAMLMLALIYWRCQPWRSLPGWNYVSEPYAEGRMPIETYLRHVETAFEEDWTVAQWLRWFHQHYIWLQHRRVVLEKLVSRRRETALFRLEDDPLSEMDSSQLGEPIMHGIGSDSPKMNGPRFTSALNILLDLSIVERDASNNYHLGEEGRSLLERFNTQTFVEWEEPSNVEATDEPD